MSSKSNAIYTVLIDLSFIFQLMVRLCKRTSNWGNYGSDDLQAALRAIDEGLPLLRASNQFGVSRRTLRRHRNNLVSLPGQVKLGRFLSVLPENIERELHDHIQFMEKRLYGLTPKDVRHLAFEIAISKTPNPFNCNTRMAGKDWLRGSFRRFGDLSIREPEGTSLFRMTGFNKHKVNHFFNIYKELLCEVPNVEASDIWNMDETGLSTVPEPGRMIATRALVMLER